MITQNNLRSNIWKYTAILSGNKRIFVAILGAYYLTVPGVDAQGIGLILLISSLGGFLFEIPSGYISDKMGHKTAIVMSRIFLVCSSLFFAFASDITFLIFGGILLSLGHAFMSGTGAAFLHETLRGLGREKEYAQVSGKVSSIGFGVPIALTMLIPFFIQFGYAVPFLIAAAIDVVVLGVAMTLVRPHVTQEEIDEIKLTKFADVMREGLRLHFFPFALFAGILAGILFSISAYRAPYQEFLGLPVIWFGVYFGAGRILATVLLLYTGWMRNHTTLFSFLTYKVIFVSIAFLVLGFVSVPWIIVIILPLINGFYWGVSKVSNSYHIDILRTSKFKATLLSVSSQLNLIVGALTGYLTGYLIVMYSYQFAFLALGTLVLLVILPIYIYILRSHKALNQELANLHR